MPNNIIVGIKIKMTQRKHLSLINMTSTSYNKKDLKWIHWSKNDGKINYDTSDAFITVWNMHENLLNLKLQC